MNSEKFIQRKKPCAKCGGLWNYKDRTCVDCTKKKKKEQYASKTAVSSTTLTPRALAKLEGQKTYTSREKCPVCDTQTKYTSSSNCVACHKMRERGKTEVSIFQVLEKLSNDPSPEELYKMYREHPDKETWYQSFKKRHPKKLDTIERIYRGEPTPEMIAFYESIYPPLTESMTYKVYVQALMLYESNPFNAKYKRGLFDAELGIHFDSRFKAGNPEYPETFQLCKRPLNDEEQWTFLNVQNGSDKKALDAFVEYCIEVMA